MAAKQVTPFETFRSLIEFYPKLGAKVAFGTMAAAARMMPTNAAISRAPEIAKDSELVIPASISSPRKRTAARKTRRKTSKRVTGRRKGA